MTRDLLDRVNNPGSSRLEPPPAAAAVQQPDSLNHGMNLELNEAYSWESVSSTPSDKYDADQRCNYGRDLPPKPGKMKKISVLYFS